MVKKMLFEMTQSPAEIAERLRKMADELDAGNLTVVEQALAVPETLKLKVELEEDHEGEIADVNFEIEIELEWSVQAED